MPITLRGQTVKQPGVPLLSPGWEAKSLRVYSHTQSIHQFPFPLTVYQFLFDNIGWKKIQEGQFRPGTHDNDPCKDLRPGPQHFNLESCTLQI